jgi:S1-C subfamily serine protease
VISGGRILTAAHVVDDQTFTLVRLNGTARKAQARVLFVSHVADLALLSVDDPTLLRDIAPLELGELPAVRDAVAAYGFPNGGETLSITEGAVARAEHEQYVHSRESLLAIQMDAAIAPGSSGGPVLRDGRIVGVAMQGFKESTIGCAVPVPLIQQFLLDVADGRLDGIPELGIAWQKLENPALKASLGVPSGETGVLLTDVDASPAGGFLEEGDVLLSLGERDIADDGTVELRSGERTNLSQVTDVMPVGARVAIRYLRDGVVNNSEIELAARGGRGSSSRGSSTGTPTTSSSVGSASCPSRRTCSTPPRSGRRLRSLCRPGAMRPPARR